MNKRVFSKISVLAVLVAAGVSVLSAVTPRKWDLRSREDWLRGKFTGISVSSEGTLSLAPNEQKIQGPAEEFYMSVLVSRSGDTYLGTGHSGRVFKINRDGKVTLFFQAAEMDVTCLAQDKKGFIYAATSPNGKIYKIDEKGKGEEFFNPAERYIWDMAFSDLGAMLVAVGESGGIYAVSPEGNGTLIFKAPQNHILCLEKLPNGDFIAGSGGNGLIYKLTPSGKPTVIMETPYEEIRSLALDKDGTVYAAGSGASSFVKAASSDPASDPAASSGKGDADVQVIVAAPAAQPDKGAVKALPAAVEAPGSRNIGAIFTVSSDGVAKTLWSSTDEMVYSMIVRPEDGRVIFGAGDKGRLYSVDKAGKASLLLQLDSEQVYRILPMEGKMKIIANNPCYIGDILPEQRLNGEYLSQALDAGIISDWGRLSWTATAEFGANIQFQTRSGNTSEPNTTWSEWSPFYQKGDEQVLSPRARFLQFKAVFKSTSGKVSPLLTRTLAYYLQANTAPEINRFDMLKPNEVMLKLPEQDDVILGAESNPADPRARKDDQMTAFLQKKAERKGYQTVTWDASDDNGDTLEYSIYIRRDDEKSWRLLQSGLDDGIFSFDTLNFPDGTYYLKLEASDRPSNPTESALKTEKVGQPFVIDNSQPEFQTVTAVKQGAMLQMEFTVTDAYSNIEEIKYMVRPGQWQVVFPVDGICDSKSEHFKFSVNLPAGADNMITVRARDSHGNVGVLRQSF